MKKIIITLAILSIATQGISYTYANIDYSKIKTTKELCKISLNAEIDPIDRGCLLGKYNKSDLNEVEIKGKKRTITGSQLLVLLDKMIDKKYAKTGAKGTGLIRAKEMFYNKLIKKVESIFNKTKNKRTKDLTGALYLTLSVGKMKLSEDYAKASQAKTENKLKARYGTTPKKTFKRDNTVTSKNKVFNKTTVNRSNVSEGFMSTGISAERIEAASHAKARANKIEWDKLTKYEKQVKLHYLMPLYVKTSPDPSILKYGLKSQIRKMKILEKGPITTGSEFRQNGEIYKHLVDDWNIYAGLMLDGGLVNYNNELVKQTGFYQTYVGPYYGDTDGTWRTGTEYGRASKDILAYFGYTMNEDPMSPDYLKLTYDKSKNKAIGQIHYIKNIRK